MKMRKMIANTTFVYSNFGSLTCNFCVGFVSSLPCCYASTVLVAFYNLINENSSDIESEPDLSRTWCVSYNFNAATIQKPSLK